MPTKTPKVVVLKSPLSASSPSASTMLIAVTLSKSDGYASPKQHILELDDFASEALNANQDSGGDTGEKSITLAYLFKCVNDAQSDDIPKNDGCASSEHHVLELDDFALGGDTDDHLAFGLHPFCPCLHRSIVQRKEAPKVVALTQERLSHRPRR
ncbi:hypothetical protein BHE74_00014571 [Ensete ventricosum]|nr:hypothetical protein BHE74_00014571 [Ensete ventricosum]